MSRHTPSIYVYLNTQETLPHAESSSAVSCSRWASKLCRLPSNIKEEIPWEMREEEEEKAFYSYQLSTIVIQINFQTVIWDLACSCTSHTKTNTHTQENNAAERSKKKEKCFGDEMRRWWDVLHYHKCTVEVCGVWTDYDNTPLVWNDATESHYTSLILIH